MAMDSHGLGVSGSYDFEEVWPEAAGLSAQTSAFHPSSPHPRPTSHTNRRAPAHINAAGRRRVFSAAVRRAARRPVFVSPSTGIEAARGDAPCDGCVNGRLVGLPVGSWPQPPPCRIPALFVNLHGYPVYLAVAHFFRRGRRASTGARLDCAAASGAAKLHGGDAPNTSARRRPALEKEKVRADTSPTFRNKRASAVSIIHSFLSEFACHCVFLVVLFSVCA